MSGAPSHGDRDGITSLPFRVVPSPIYPPRTSSFTSFFCFFFPLFFSVGSSLAPWIRLFSNYDYKWVLPWPCVCVRVVCPSKLFLIIIYGVWSCMLIASQYHDGLLSIEVRWVKALKLWSLEGGRQTNGRTDGWIDGLIDWLIVVPSRTDDREDLLLIPRAIWLYKYV